MPLLFCKFIAVIECSFAGLQKTGTLPNVADLMDGVKRIKLPQYAGRLAEEEKTDDFGGKPPAGSRFGRR